MIEESVELTSAITTKKSTTILSESGRKVQHQIYSIESMREIEKH